MSTTFDDAFAACRARYGAPIDHVVVNTLTVAVWDVGGGVALMLESGMNGVLLTASTIDMEECWMLHDEFPSYTSDPPVPLTTALDGADAFRAEHAQPKGR